MRAISVALLVALLTGTFLFGGCVSCTQFFMVGAAKSCCDETGECTKMPVEAQSLVQVHAPVVIPSAVEAAALQGFRTSVDVGVEFVAFSGGLEHPHPDIHILNATFLV